MDFKIYNNEKIFIYDVENYIEMMSTKKEKQKLSFYKAYIGVDVLVKIKRSKDRITNIFKYNSKDFNICI